MWKLDAPDPGSGARVLIRANAMVLLVPRSELTATGELTFGIEASLDGGPVVEPAAAKVQSGAIVVESPPGEAGPATTEPADPKDVVAEFLPRLFEELHANKLYAFDHLHPVAIERYGDEECRSFVTGTPRPPVEVVVVSVGDPEPFDYASDGLSQSLPGAYPVVIEQTDGGETVTRTTHVWLVESGSDAQFPVWIADCGDPVAP